MSDITELEGRITAALDRIRQGLEGLEGAQAGGDGGAAEAAAEAESLRGALEEERLANAQLEERVKALKDRQDSVIAPLEEEKVDLAGQLSGIDGELQRLRRANAQLRENNNALREAMSAGLAEPHLVNKSMTAELEALRADRAAEAAEIDAVLGALKPLLDEAS